MGMNQFLAELYSTPETVGADSSDVAKLAEAQILTDALSAEGIDVNQLPADAILKVAYELFGDDSAIVKSAAEAEGEGAEGEGGEGGEEPKDKKKEDEEESMEEKVAQADFLGRVMAHSFVQEQGLIQKEAGVAGLLAKGKGLAGKAVGAVKGAPAQLAEKGRAMQGSYQGARRGAEFGIGGAAPMGKVRSALQVAKEHPKTVGGAGLAALGGAAAAAAAAKGSKKEGSALDVLAEQRALEILQEHGVGVQDEQQKLASAVEQRAWEMLQQAGYVES